MSAAAEPFSGTGPPAGAELPGGDDVALVHDWLTGMRGGEKVLQEIAVLFPAAPIYTLFHFPGSVSADLEAHPVHASYLNRAPGARRHYRRYLPFFPAAIEDFDLGRHRLVISSSHCAAKGVVPAPDALHLCYCHSPMRYAWDQEHAYFPRRRGLVARLRRQALSALRTWDVAAAARVDAFAANSSFVARRIERYYRRDAEVIPPPVDVDFFTPGEAAGAEHGDGGGSDSAYCLTVAAPAPYKRLEVALAACESAGVQLRLVGDGPGRERLQRLAGPRARFLGRVDGDELRALYRGALCLLQPGVEDFGIAPVEALACGTPVVALGRGGVLDVVRDGEHGILYPGVGDGGAEEVARLAAAIDKCRRIEFNELNLRSRAEAFSRSRFVERFRRFVGSHLARSQRPTTPGAPPS